MVDIVKRCAVCNHYIMWHQTAVEYHGKWYHQKCATNEDTPNSYNQINNKNPRI